MTAKKATSRGPLGCWARTASSSARAWRGFTTLRRSTWLDTFGAVHFSARIGFVSSRPQLDRVVHGVGQDDAVPPGGARGCVLAVQSVPVAWSSILRAVAASASADTGALLRATQARTSAISSGGSGALLGVEAPAEQCPADARVVGPSAGFGQHRGCGRGQALGRCPCGTWPRPASTSCPRRRRRTRTR